MGLTHLLTIWNNEMAGLVIVQNPTTNRLAVNCHLERIASQVGGQPNRQFITAQVPGDADGDLFR